jgi:hypothetical protein
MTGVSHAGGPPTLTRMSPVCRLVTPCNLQETALSICALPRRSRFTPIKHPSPHFASVKFISRLVTSFACSHDGQWTCQEAFEMDD